MTNLIGDRSENGGKRSRIDSFVVEVREHGRRSTTFRSERLDSQDGQKEYRVRGR